MYVAKTKALISFAVTAKLICVFIFAYAKKRFLRHGSIVGMLTRIASVLLKVQIEGV